MRRVTTLLLEVALLLSAVVAIGYLIRMVVAWFLPIQWFWGGALAAIAAPALMALALFVSARVPVAGMKNAQG